MPCVKLQRKSLIQQARWQRGFRRLCGMRFPTEMTATPFFWLRRQFLSQRRWGSRITDGTTEVGRTFHVCWRGNIDAGFQTLL
jgi:hypothetical protein